MPGALTNNGVIFMKNSAGNHPYCWCGAVVDGAGDGLIQIDNGDNTFNLAVKAYPGYGIAVESQGVRIGDDWSAIPTLA